MYSNDFVVYWEGRMGGGVWKHQSYQSGGTIVAWKAFCNYIEELRSILDKIREVPDVSIFRDATKQISTMLLGGEQLFCSVLKQLLN